MERAQRLRSKRYESPKSEQITLVFIIILFHAVGLIGLFIEAARPAFLKIVPWHILLMLLVIIISHKPLNARFLIFAIMVYLLGFSAEWIGVHKNWVFGDYGYGKTLGIKVSDIPLTIGINWFLLIYSAGVLMQHLRIRSMLMRIISGAIILVLLDLLIERVAIKFDYWHWMNNIIPIKNYIGWFLMSGLMLFIFEKFKFLQQSMVGPVLLITQFVFFGFLHFA